MKDKLEAWIQVEGFPGFEVKLAYLSRPELEKVRKSVTRMVLNKRTRAMEEEVDSDAFTKVLVKAAILDWKGFTIGYALKMLPIEVPEGTPEDELISFTLEDALQLVQNSPIFDSWLNEAIFDLDSFRTKS
jgi:hypothetical protein